MSDEKTTRITVTLSMTEWRALRERAVSEYRHPREQARFLLRDVLLGSSAPPQPAVRQSAIPSAVQAG